MTLTQDLLKAAGRSRAWACYDCGKCTATCPVSRTGRDYSPRRHVLATVLGHEDEILSDGKIHACLTCSLCDQRCPAQVRYTDLMLLLREMAHREGVEPECPHGGALQSVMRMMAGGKTEQDRMGWMPSDLRADPEKGEVFYWTGCSMYYDAFFPELESRALRGTEAAVRALNRLGIVPVVSPRERCCGHDLLWNGDRASFERLAEHNVDLVAGSGAATLVVSCAECLRTWSIDYAPRFKGKAPRIVHISTYLLERLPDLRIAAREPLRVTYQDPCRLGRHLGIYDPPRELLAGIPGVELIEMRHARAAAGCCAGGTWSDCDRFAKQIQVSRLREARATGAEVLVTACPKCQIHFRCAMKDPKVGEEVQIEMRDLAEIVAEALAPNE
ncbi:MAG: (Fe-S)-binding protein [Candidatus Eisenbacteria bacterium]|nr:(Fe-S)-binding protein [Candidatus Eisenbacteria bacterium]